MDKTKTPQNLFYPNNAAFVFCFFYLFRGAMGVIMQLKISNRHKANIASRERGKKQRDRIVQKHNMENRNKIRR